MKRACHPHGPLPAAFIIHHPHLLASSLPSLTQATAQDIQVSPESTFNVGSTVIVACKVRRCGTASSPFALLLLSFISFDPLSNITTRRIAVAPRVAMRCRRRQPGRPDLILSTCCASARCLPFPSLPVSPFIYLFYAPFNGVVFFRNALRRPVTLSHEVPRTGLQSRCRTALIEDKSVRSWMFLISLLTAHEIARVNVSCGA